MFFVSKIYFHFDENSFESIDDSSVLTVSDAKEESQKDITIKPENKKDKTNETRAKKSETDDINNDEGTDNEEGKFLVPFESVVVNLGGVDSRRYLRVQINLETSNENAQNKLNEMMVILRDKIISILSKKTSKDLKSEGNLLKLRLEIKNILNDLLGSNNIIKKVYFSDFIVQ